jgi:hypothetical protein
MTDDSPDKSQWQIFARVIAGRLIMPAELQRIHRFLLDTAVIEGISDETRAMVESPWPELMYKLPPKRPDI